LRQKLNDSADALEREAGDLALAHRRPRLGDSNSYCSGLPEVWQQREYHPTAFLIRLLTHATPQSEPAAVGVRSVSLVPGVRIGPYEVVSTIGHGGMGEVYRARDTKLGRDVALKVLPMAFAGDAERLARFEREARTLATLNHPNIAAIYGFEQAESGPVLVMELVEGRSLEDVIAGAPAGVPLDEALGIARQMADALEAAHDAGIVHRDLKPANVKVRPDGTVKVLDFGLAKALDPGASGVGGSGGVTGTFATMTSPAMTAQGMILGTASYMAPEQARGRQVDRRADIWAFGVVLYELVTGERLFAGESVADVLAAVMTREPDLTKLPASMPPAVRALIQRCLDRDPKQRLQAIGEARIALSHPDAAGSLGGTVTSPPVASRRSPVSTAGRAAAALAVVTAAVWLGAQLGGTPAAERVRKLDVAIDVLQADDQGAPVVSPDGTKVLYRADGRLWVRDLGSVEPVALPGSEDGIFPTWSTDSRFVAYARMGERVWKSPAGGGAPLAIGHTPDGLSGSGGLAWTADGRIIISGAPDAGLTAMSDSGGVAEVLVPIDRSTESDFHEISLLPDGRSVVYVTHVEGRVDTIEAFRDGERKVVLRVPGDELRFPAYGAGYLVFERRRLNPGVWAVRFSPDRLELEGEMFPVAGEAGMPSIAADGTLGYVRFADMRRDLVWIDRTGSIDSAVALPERADSPRLSSDGRRAAFTMGAAYDVWTAELDTGALSRLTAEASAFTPLWSPDGTRVVYGAFAGRPTINVYSVRSDGTGEPSRLTTSNSLERPLDVTHDGLRLFLVNESQGRPLQITVMPADGSAPPTALFQTPFDELWGSLSPDDRWMAYESTESGRSEVSVRPVEPGAARVPVSTEGGRVPKWSPDGRTIYYRQGTSMMGAAVTIQQDKVVVGRPEPVLELPLDLGLTDNYDVSADRERFLFIRRQGKQRVTLVLNWPAEATRLEGGR